MRGLFGSTVEAGCVCTLCFSLPFSNAHVPVIDDRRRSIAIEETVYSLVLAAVKPQKDKLYPASGFESMHPAESKVDLKVQRNVFRCRFQAF